jgi:hypothetical protein
MGGWIRIVIDFVWDKLKHGLPKMTGCNIHVKKLLPVQGVLVHVGEWYKSYSVSEHE